MSKKQNSILPSSLKDIFTEYRYLVDFIYLFIFALFVLSTSNMTFHQTFSLHGFHLEDYFILTFVPFSTLTMMCLGVYVCIYLFCLESFELVGSLVCYHSLVPEKFWPLFLQVVHLPCSHFFILRLQ